MGQMGRCDKKFWERAQGLMGLMDKMESRSLKGLMEFPLVPLHPLLPFLFPYGVTVSAGAAAVVVCEPASEVGAGAEALLSGAADVGVEVLTGAVTVVGVEVLSPATCPEDGVGDDEEVVEGEMMLVLPPEGAEITERFWEDTEGVSKG